MSPLLLSRARLRRDVPAAALWRQLAPEDDSRRMHASHRLVWTLFADGPERTRDFLWRESEPGEFYFLSNRAPDDRHNLFEVDPPKVFAPQLGAGDVLRFSLRANATVAKRPEASTGSRARGKPSDVVMNALYALPKGRARAECRRDVVGTAGAAWLQARGEKCGFHLDTAHECVTSYQVMQFDHDRTKVRAGVLDFDGVLVVDNPDRLIEAIGLGFGRAKAFGCGLMLIRRA